MASIIECPVDGHICTRDSCTKHPNNPDCVVKIDVESETIALKVLGNPLLLQDRRTFVEDNILTPSATMAQELDVNPDAFAVFLNTAVIIKINANTNAREN